MEFLRTFLSRSLERKFVFFVVAMVAIAIVSVATIATQSIQQSISLSFQIRVAEKLSLAATVLDESPGSPDVGRARRLLIHFFRDPDLAAIVYLPDGPGSAPIVLQGSIPRGVDIPTDILLRPQPVLLFPAGSDDNLVAWSIPSAGGAVVALFSRDTVRAFLYHVNMKLLQVATVVCILSWFLGLFMARLILRPVEKFITAMRGIAEGRDVGELTTLEQNELGDWTRTFNLMIAQLRHKHNLELFLLGREKNELVMHIASGLAHRIRTPLTSINSLTQLITRGGDQQKLQEWATVILQNVQNLDEAINQFLDYAQPGAPTFRERRLSETLGFALALMEPDLAASGIGLERQMPSGEEPTLLLDDQQLQQAFINVIKNSARTVKSGGFVRVKLEYPEGPSTARITVEDSGEPVPEELRARIFEPFVDMTSRDSGVGLSVAARLFEMHGGRIELARSDSQGKRFVISLPRQSLEELQIRAVPPE